MAAPEKSGSHDGTGMTAAPPAASERVAVGVSFSEEDVRRSLLELGHGAVSTERLQQLTQAVQLLALEAQCGAPVVHGSDPSNAMATASPMTIASGGRGEHVLGRPTKTSGDDDVVNVSRRHDDVHVTDRSLPRSDVDGSEDEEASDRDGESDESDHPGGSRSQGLVGGYHGNSFSKHASSSPIRRRQHHRPAAPPVTEARPSGGLSDRPVWPGVPTSTAVATNRSHYHTAAATPDMSVTSAFSVNGSRELAATADDTPPPTDQRPAASQDGSDRIINTTQTLSRNSAGQPATIGRSNGDDGGAAAVAAVLPRQRGGRVAAVPRWPLEALDLQARQLEAVVQKSHGSRKIPATGSTGTSAPTGDVSAHARPRHHPSARGLRSDDDHSRAPDGHVVPDLPPPDANFPRRRTDGSAAPRANAESHTRAQPTKPVNKSSKKQKKTSASTVMLPGEGVGANVGTNAATAVPQMKRFVLRHTDGKATVSDESFLSSTDEHTDCSSPRRRTGVRAVKQGARSSALAVADDDHRVTERHDWLENYDIADLSSYAEWEAGGASHHQSAADATSFIRPQTSQCRAFRKSGKCDPVQRFHDFNRTWSSLKLPGEEKHKRLRWNVREVMARKYEVKHDRERFAPNQYVVPTDKKRQQLRWDVRTSLAAD